MRLKERADALSANTHRLAVMMSAADRGWSPETAAIVAMALHPLDDSPVPSRRFEKTVRKLSRKNARSFRQASDSEAAASATSIVMQYRDLALEMNEPHYMTRFDKPLGLTD